MGLIGIGAYYNVKPLAVLGIIPIITAALRWCPLNAAVGYNGCTDQQGANQIRKL
nr:YgaP-like transmembrane domain [uncultured Pontibacter sp.]